MKPVSKGRRRRATIDDPCDLERLQRAFKLAADRKVAADVERSVCSGDGAGNLPKRPAIGGRPRRATVNGPRPMENLQRAYKLAADAKVATGVVDSSARSSDATVKSGNNAGSKMPRQLRNKDVDSSNHTAYKPPHPKLTTAIFPTRFNETTTKARRTTIGDPPSSAQMESLRNDRRGAVAASKNAGPKFIPPLRDYHHEGAIDRKASDRARFASSSPELSSIGWGESARAPPPPRRATIGDPLSSAQVESLRYDRCKAAASKNVGPRFVPPLRNYDDEEAVDWKASERARFPSPSLRPSFVGPGERARAPPPPRRATIGDALSSAQVEGLRNNRYEVAASENAGPKFVPPLRNYDDKEAMGWNASASLESSSAGLCEPARAPPLMSPEGNFTGSESKPIRCKANVVPSVRRSKQPFDPSAGATRRVHDETSADGSTAAALLRDVGGTSSRVLGEEKISPEPHVGYLVRTKNKLDESVSSLDESMLSNMTVVSGVVVDEREASFQSPFCVSDFRDPNETRQTSGKSKAPDSNIVRRAMRGASNIASDAIPVSKSKRLSTMRPGDADGNLRLPGSQTNGSRKANAFSHRETKIDRPNGRPHGPARRAADHGTGPRSRNGHRAGENEGPSDRRADYIKRLLKDHNEKLDALMVRGPSHRRALL